MTAEDKDGLVIIGIVGFLLVVFVVMMVTR
jgi:hypothetical protein